MKKNVIIAAGGSGGHIYPALAIAQAAEKLDAEIEVHFVGTPHGLENKMIPREGYPLHHVPIGRLNRNARRLERIKTILLLPLAFVKSLLILLKLRPVWVLGVGGFASGPVLFVASMFGFKSFIWEPNAYPGMANRWLSRFVSEGFLLFEDAAKSLRLPKWKKVGYPLRAQFEKFCPSGQGDKVNSDEKLKVLVFGGSQGARGINNVVCQAIEEGGDWLDGVEIVHQTGVLDFQTIKQAYENSQNSAGVQVFEFLYDMDERYRWADLVICRSGMGTLAELAACGQAGILVPLPTAADDHQRKNAEVLMKAGAAQMILQKELSSDLLKKQIVELKRNREKIRELSNKIREFHKPLAADEIAGHILKSSSQELS